MDIQKFNDLSLDFLVYLLNLTDYSCGVITPSFGIMNGYCHRLHHYICERYEPQCKQNYGVTLLENNDKCNFNRSLYTSDKPSFMIAIKFKAMSLSLYSSNVFRIESYRIHRICRKIIF